MSVRVPSIAFAGKEEKSELPYSFAFTSSELHGAVLDLAALLPLLIELAEVEKTCSMLADEIEKYGYDRNGDGEVIVRINTFEIAQGEAASVTDPNMQMAGFVKLSGDLQTGESYIFLTDDASFISYGRDEGVFAYLDGSTPEEGATDYENMRLPMSECKGLADTEVGQLLSDYSFSIRQVRSDLLEDNPQYYIDAKELFENLVNGTPLNDGTAVSSESP